MTKKKAGDRKVAKQKKPAIPTPEEEEAKAADAFMTEVEADIRDEQLQKFWDTYKGLIFGAMAVLVLAVAAVQLWQGMEEDRLAAQADTFARATEHLADGDQDSALADLAAVAQEGGAYGALADLQRAGVLLEQDKRDEALEIYRSLSADSSLDYVFVDVATLLWAIHGIESEDSAVLLDALAPLTDPGNSYSYLALELTALLSVREGNMSEAAAVFEQLIQDSNTPASIKARAQEMAAVFNSPVGAGTKRDSSADETSSPDNQAEAP